MENIRKGLTVNQLMAECERLIKEGNGNKQILISSDDEANMYHTLYFGFNSDTNGIALLRCKFHDKDNPSDVVLLG